MIYLTLCKESTVSNAKKLNVFLELTEFNNTFWIML